jgi:Putative Ig domain
VSIIQVNAQILTSDLASAGSFPISVATPGTPEVVSNPVSFTVTAPSPLSFNTSSLPSSADGKAYYFLLAGGGGVPPVMWSLSSGTLPAGLSLDSSTGLITGTASGVGTSNFTIQLSDSAATPHVATQPMSISLMPSLGRNDNITACGGTDTATPISNGTLRASISPYGDVDTYSFTLTQPTDNLSVETFAQRISIGNNLNVRHDFLDTVIELLDSSCNVIGLNDDIFVPTDPNVTGTQDSKIVVGAAPFPPSPVCTAQNQIGAPCSDRTPPASLQAGTYYIRVRDYRGDGRPDMIYDLTVSGVQ